MAGLPNPVFIDTDIEKIKADTVAFYEGLVGKKLEPAQVERLVLNTFAFREQLIRNAVQMAALQNLVAFANFPQLDYLGELVGVRRLAPAPAETTIGFTIVPGSAALTIPAGFRVQTADGKIVFQLLEPISVGATSIGDPPTTVYGICAAQTDGIVGNGYDIGAINVILDPAAYLVGVSNTLVSFGGSDEESDEQMRERIKLAPSSYSVAGPTGAYKFFARSAHPSIIDVGVLSPLPGTVVVYPLSDLGLPTPAPVLTAVEAALNPDTVRPLSDIVSALSPTLINYNIEIEMYLLSDAPQAEIEAEVTRLVTAYADGKGKALGLDVVRSQIIGAAQIEGVYSIDLIYPGVDIVVLENEVARPLLITITTIGFKDA